MLARKTLILLVMLTTVLFCNISFAEELIPAAKQSSLETAAASVQPHNSTDDNAKSVVATIYINNAKSTYDAEIMQKLADRFNAKLQMYELRNGDQYIEKLHKLGVTDITVAERADILEAFAGERIDYVVYAEVQPPIIKYWMSFFNQGYAATVTIPVKIIDVKNSKYIYNGKFTEQADNSAVFGGVGTKAAVLKAIDQILFKTDELLINKMPIRH